MTSPTGRGAHQNKNLNNNINKKKRKMPLPQKRKTSLPQKRKMSSSPSSLVLSSSSLKASKSPPSQQQKPSTTPKPSKHKQQKQKQKQQPSPYMREVIGKSVQIKFDHIINVDDVDDDEDNTTNTTTKKNNKNKRKQKLPTKFYAGVIHDMKASYKRNNRKKNNNNKKRIWHYVKYDDNDSGWVDLSYMESIGSLKWPTTNTNTSTTTKTTTTTTASTTKSSSTKTSKPEEIAVATAKATNTSSFASSSSSKDDDDDEESSPTKAATTTTNTNTTPIIPDSRLSSSTDENFGRLQPFMDPSLTPTLTTGCEEMKLYRGPSEPINAPWVNQPFSKDIYELLVKKVVNIKYSWNTGTYTLISTNIFNYIQSSPKLFGLFELQKYCCLNSYEEYILQKGVTKILLNEFQRWTYYAFVPGKFNDWRNTPVLTKTQVIQLLKKLGFKTIVECDDDGSNQTKYWKSPTPPTPGVVTMKNATSSGDGDDDDDGNSSNNNQRLLDSKYDTFEDLCSALQRIEDIEEACSGGQQQHKQKQLEANNTSTSMTTSSRASPRHRSIPPKLTNQETMALRLYLAESLFKVDEHNEEEEEEEKEIDCNDNEEQEQEGDVEDQDEDSSDDASSSSNKNTSKMAAPIIKDYKGLKFAQKIWLMVNETAQNYPKILSWIEDGKAFQIHDNQQLESKILLNYFDCVRSNRTKVNHNFKRNLKWYGFTLIGCNDDPHQDGCIFQHKHFVAQDYDLASKISRLIKYPSSWKTSSSVTSNNQNDEDNDDDDDVGSDDDAEQDEGDLDWNNQDSDDDDDASTSSSEQEKKKKKKKKKRQRNHSKLPSRARKKRKSVATAASTVVEIEDEDEDDDIYPTSEKKKKHRRTFHPRGKTQRFPEKLWEILENPSWKKIIAWVDNGRAFKVHNREKFESIIYPQYFPYVCSEQTLPYHNFQRNLRSYGFERLDHGYFRHPMFVRHNQEKAESIECRRENQKAWSRLNERCVITTRDVPVDEDDSEEEEEYEDYEDLHNLPFPKKLWQILDWAEKDPRWKGIVSWTNNGTAFRIHNRKAFESVVMPFYFRAGKNDHTRRYPFSNFKHTLRWYGFVMVQEQCYRHERFTRRNRKQAEQVAMLKSCPTVQEATDLSPAIMTEEVNEDVDESSVDDEDESFKSDQDDDDDEEMDFEENRKLRFPEKLWHMLNRSERNPKWKKILSWTDHGTVIQVYDREDFIKTIMPCYFSWKPSREVYVSNFQRSLRDYGFERFKRSYDDIYDDCYRHMSFTRHDSKGAKSIVYLGTKQYKTWSYAQHNLKTTRQPPYPDFVSILSSDSRGIEERSTSWSSSRATTSNRRAGKKRKRNSSLSIQNKEEEEDDDDEEKEDFTKMTVPELAEIFQRKHEEMGDIMALLNQKLAAEEEEEEVKKGEGEDDNVGTNQNNIQEEQQGEPPQGQGGEMIHDDTATNNNGDESEIRASMLREMNVDSLEL